MGAEPATAAAGPIAAHAKGEGAEVFVPLRDERLEAGIAIEAGARRGAPVNAVVAALAGARVRFVVIGGQAVRILGYPRATIDWDLFVPPRDTENFKKIDAVLNEVAPPGEYDMAIEPLGPNGQNFIQTYQLQWCLLQFHLVVPGIKNFEEAEQQAVEVTDAGIAFKRLSGAMLLKAKEAAGRAQDQEDIKFLRELQRAGRLL